MTCMENCPVLAAYGSLRSGSAQPWTPGRAGQEAGGEGGLPAGGGGRAGAAAQPPAAAGAAEEAPAGGGEAAELASPNSGGAAEVAPAAAEAAEVAPVAATERPLAAPQVQQMQVTAAVEAGSAAAGAGSAPARPPAEASCDGRLEAYLRSLQQPSRYGYMSIGHEWDIW